MQWYRYWTSPTESMWQTEEAPGHRIVDEGRFDAVWAVAYNVEGGDPKSRSEYADGTLDRLLDYRYETALKRMALTDKIASESTDG